MKPEDDTSKTAGKKKGILIKPLIKWVGGKTQIVEKLISDFPVEMNNYREIFLGGGSVLLAFLMKVECGKIRVHGHIYAYDSNEPLIHLFKNVQRNPDAVYLETQKLIGELSTCRDGEINRKPQTLEEARASKQNYYYWIRKRYNSLSVNDKQTPTGSSMFIFLNKTCFRGIFRIGPNGFNVPYGNYKNPEVIHRDHLYAVHNLIQHVIFECSDFRDSLNRVEADDFVYLDPPYAPESERSFVGYTACGFDTDKHTALFRIIHELTLSNKKLMMSNSDVEFVRDNFSMSKYSVVSIVCKRSIHSKNPESRTREVIIKNY